MASLPVEDPVGKPFPPMEIGPLSPDHALDICSWRYPAPYDCYDMTDADPDELLLPELGFHSLSQAAGSLDFARSARTGKYRAGTTTTRHSTPAARCGHSSSARGSAAKPFQPDWPSGANGLPRRHFE